MPGARGRQEQPPVVHAVAGAIAGCVSRFVVGPLDVIKIRFQVQVEPIAAGAPGAGSKYTGIAQAFKAILREEGIQGLWRGTVPGQLLSVPYTAVQFVALQECKAVAERLGLQGSPPWVSFLSGGLAGAAATIASYPFDLLRTTLAAQGEPKVYSGMIDAARKIVEVRGMPGLYMGLGVTLMEIFPYSAITFGSYDYFNAVWTSRVGSKDGSPSTLQTFMCGLMAGIVAKLVTAPLDVAKKRYQVAGLKRSIQYGKRIEPKAVQNLAICFTELYKQEGLAGLWKGSLPNILKAGPAAAVTFLSYEFVLRHLLVGRQG
ncbi:unnamed protein product [Ostreobium quekettii]|uniref:Mitochondrial thiamine pyrophosphate carrier n=1 Tax=Ostreobium quekettii TaxID=121088 RepID=A0A8S1IKX9_9CHLO|nr:unnamed protein product [Ostreobium quekettii]|eukprot:evm.model.scf_48.16 EVM.evm.TU.scf_48.16   scf_48:101790-105016(-)